MGLAANSPVLDRYTHLTDSQVANGAKKAFGVNDIQPVKEEVNPLIGKLCPRCGTLNRNADTLCSKCFYSIDYENTGLEIELLEMFRCKFSKSANLDVVFNHYRHFKQEMNLLGHFKSLLQGKSTIDTDVVRQYLCNNFRLTDDQIVEFLQILMGEQVIDIVGDSIFVLGMETLEDYIQKSKEFLALDNRYVISKEGG